MSKYRDRKLGRTFSFAGWDCYSDTTARGHIRNAFEAGTSIVSNWDVMEHILDYIFVKLGMNGGDGGVDMPIVMTEAVANLPYTWKSKSARVLVCYDQGWKGGSGSAAAKVRKILLIGHLVQL